MTVDESIRECLDTDVGLANNETRTVSNKTDSRRHVGESESEMRKRWRTRLPVLMKIEEKSEEKGEWWQRAEVVAVEVDEDA